ncbi:MAG: hypothetical protein Q8N96_07685 [Methylovulum sp.]|nr:hypothetical protein [Methylovulum sp.]
MNLRHRLTALEQKTSAELRYVIRLIERNDSFDFADALKAAKIERGWQTVPDNDIFVIHRIIVKPPLRH